MSRRGPSGSGRVGGRASSSRPSESGLANRRVLTSALLVAVTVTTACSGAGLLARGTACSSRTTPVSGDVLAGDGQQIMLGLVSDDDGAVIGVGSDGPADRDDAAVWTSGDGAEWQMAAPGRAVFGGRGQQKMFDVTRGGPGVVAVGWEQRGDDRDAAVWTSTDGLTWCRVEHDESVLGGPGWQTMLAVTEGPRGFVAVGWDAARGDQDAAIWTSADGLVWSRVPHEEVLFGGEGGQYIGDVTQGGRGLVAVGGSDVGRPLPVVWTSSDGIEWQRTDVALDGDETSGRLYAVTEGGPGLVAVGEDLSTSAGSSLFVGDSGVTRVGGAGVWTSVDGLSWQQVVDHEPVFHDRAPGRGRAILDVTAGGPGLVAVGWEGFPGTEDAAVWTSTDGSRWLKMTDSAFGGAGLQIMTAVAEGGPGLVAVGQHSVQNRWDAAVWTSTDGLAWERISPGGG